MSNITTYIKGRGAQTNPSNPFHHTVRSAEIKPDPDRMIKTVAIETEAHTIVNKVDSPDIGFNYSINPYQGCEHGCVYCYARNTHTYWGYSCGLDFETKIMVKTNAAALLKKRLEHTDWTASPIMLSGNTDCYQPLERQYEITRSLLHVFMQYRHPVAIVTKNSLILRDLEILKELSRDHLVRVCISINTLNDRVRHKLEPRASSIHTRIKTAQILIENDIPVSVLAAPIIPGLNDTGIFNLVRKLGDIGVQDIKHIVLRLNGGLGLVFEDWLDKNYPMRKEKIMNKVKSMHDGYIHDSRFHKRMSGTGQIADIIKDQFDVARKLYLKPAPPVEFNTSLYEKRKNAQLSLF